MGNTTIDKVLKIRSLGSIELMLYQKNIVKPDYGVLLTLPCNFWWLIVRTESPGKTTCWFPFPDSINRNIRSDLPKHKIEVNGTINNVVVRTSRNVNYLIRIFFPSQHNWSGKFRLLEEWLWNFLFESWDDKHQLILHSKNYWRDFNFLRKEIIGIVDPSFHQCDACVVACCNSM